MFAVIKGLQHRLPSIKFRVPKRVRHIALSASILLVLLLGVGVTYTWYMDRQPQQITEAPASSTASYTAITPHKPSPDAAEGVSAQMVTSPVSRGSEATVSVQTDPSSTCKIAVIYNYDPSIKQTPVSDPALAPQTADTYGSASWTWTVGPTAALGKGNATVTCAYHTRTGVVQAEVDVTE